MIYFKLKLVAPVNNPVPENFNVVSDTAKSSLDAFSIAPQKNMRYNGCNIKVRWEE